MGDVEVDENGPLPGQLVAGDDNQNEDANDNDNDDDGANADGDASDGGGGGGGDGGDSIEGAVVPPDVEPEDPAMGFEYEGEVRQ